MEPFTIDVESATESTWTLFEGIGPSRARRIDRFLREHGPLQSIDELARVPGLPRDWLEKARPWLRLRGEGSRTDRASEAQQAKAEKSSEGRP